MYSPIGKEFAVRERTLPDGGLRRSPRISGWRAAAGTLGPAFVAAVAYIDPGNFATNVTAGARHGTMLLWVIVLASAIGMLVQYLSAKLGLVTGRSLPELCRESMPGPWRIAMWLQAELVVVMTDLAEIVGGSIALQMLFGLPLFAGALVMVATVSVILALSVRGQDAFRPVVYVSIALIALGFAYQATLAHLSPAAVGAGLVPRLDGADSAYLAAGIVGATVMPHVVYLHSGLTTGISRGSRRSLADLVRITRAQIIAAMLLAATVNASILLAATALPGSAAESLQSAQHGFVVRTGAAAGLVFALALLASSVASTCVGVYSGQMIMQGFLRRQVSVWLRRAVSVIPALVVLAIGVNATDALVLSQVFLSFGIPFALVPLVIFTSRRALMGAAVNSPVTIGVAGLILGFVIILNAYLLWTVFT